MLQNYSQTLFYSSILFHTFSCEYPFSLYLTLLVLIQVSMGTSKNFKDVFPKYWRVVLSFWSRWQGGIKLVLCLVLLSCWYRSYWEDFTIFWILNIQTRYGRYSQIHKQRPTCSPKKLNLDYNYQLVADVKLLLSEWYIHNSHKIVL